MAKSTARAQRRQALAPSSGHPKAQGDAPELEAAARLFRRAGFSGTTVREIAREAGMLPGSLHYRYPTKDALLHALMSSAIARVVAAIRAALEGTDAPAERLRLAVRTHLELVLSSDAFYVLLYDWRSLDEAARGPLLALRATYERFWDGLLQDAVDAGLARPGVDVALVRNFGFGALNWVAQWYEPEAGLSPADIADHFWAYFAFGLLAEPLREGLPVPPQFEALARGRVPGPRAARRSR